jgi:hypothetical protein
MSRAGARNFVRAFLACAASGLALACAPGASVAQHAYTVGPPNEFYEHHHFGPVRHDTDADRGCLGGYNSNVPYATDTCLPAGVPNFTMTRTLGASVAPAGLLDRPVEVPDAIASCWRPPAGASRQITLRVAFSAAARPLGAKITYVAAPDAKAKADLKASLLGALQDCAALRFTPSLGKAIAGRPFAIRFILPARS